MALAQREALSELDVAEQRFRVRVVRGTVGRPHTPPEGVQAEAAPGERITSPLRGVFYRCPAPDAEPYIEVGQRVHPGQVVGLLEAMKVFNEVTAHVEGVVISIPPHDGSLVEEGETLVLIEPAE